jgi:hypothetical protein
MKKTVALIERLIQLAEGKALPASSLRGDWFLQMKDDGILLTVPHRSRKTLRVADANSFRHYLASQYDIRDLEATLTLLGQQELGRCSQVNVTGDSKFVQHRTFQGFLVNSYQPIPAKLNGEPITILPPDGSFVFIFDYQSFSVPEDVIIVGMENAENFRYVKRQHHLFKRYFPNDSRLLFMSRYPQQQHSDLIHWLKSIPNRYVHFGDLDLAGIAIYQNEYYRHLGERSSFLIPDDYEERIANGTRSRYNDQISKYRRMKIEDPRIGNLLSCILQYHRGYDQEGYIE